jgi:hypothetical protein
MSGYFETRQNIYRKEWRINVDGNVYRILVSFMSVMSRLSAMTLHFIGPCYFPAEFFCGYNQSVVGKVTWVYPRVCRCVFTISWTKGYKKGEATELSDCYLCAARPTHIIVSPAQLWIAMMLSLWSRVSWMFVTVPCPQYWRYTSMGTQIMIAEQLVQWVLARDETCPWGHFFHWWSFVMGPNKQLSGRPADWRGSCLLRVSMHFKITALYRSSLVGYHSNELNSALNVLSRPYQNLFQCLGIRPLKPWYCYSSVYCGLHSLKPQDLWNVLFPNSTGRQSYWVSGLCPSSEILKTTKQNVSETGSVSVLTWGEETSKLLGSLEGANLSYWTTDYKWLRLALSKGLNRVCVPSAHLRAEIDPFSETFCFIVFTIPGKARSPDTH